MAEQRKFQMHEKLLLDVILKQAGSVQKAVLEGVMNSIEAGASRVDVSVTPRLFSIADDGKGFRSREEIEKFFETFGQPHEASEGKVWAQFRMGRGQMFAFGKNTWRTGRFVMQVDIKQRLGYDLVDDAQQHDGCDIAVELYNPLSDRDLYGIVREIERYVKYVSIPVMVNGQQVNTPPDTKKWGGETNDAAYIRLNENGSRLEIYNLGVFVCELSKYTHGVAGVIVSKQRLEVNFARNDVIRSCPVWKRIMKAVEDSNPVQKVKNKRVLSPEERFNVIERLCSGELDIADTRKTQVFLDVSGHPWSVNSLVKANFPCWTFAPAGSMEGDKLIQAHKALVLDEEVVRAFSCKPEDVLTHKWKQVNKANEPASWDDSLLPHWQKLPFRKFSDLIREDGGVHYLVIPEDKWTRNEWMWIRIASDIQQNLGGRWNKRRRLMLGSSDAYNGWTDGSSYIVIAREFLRSHPLQQEDRPILSSLVDVAMLILHELCHTEDSKTNVHSPEFYKAFHEECRGAIGYCIKAVYSSLCNGGLRRIEEQSKKRNEPEAEKVSQPEPLKVAADTPAPPKAPPTVPKTPKPPKEPKVAKAGRVASEVTDAETVNRVCSLYKGNGGTMTYDQIEEQADLNLRKSNGMTAYRIIQRRKAEAK
jgi:hypothetical protein